MQDEVFRAGADAYLGTPNAESGADVIAGVAALMMPPRLLVESICDPRDRPNLTTMGVAAELEVDGGLFGFLELVGLVVEEQAETVRVGCEITQGGAPTGHTVVASDDVYALEVGYRVLQQSDAGFLEEAGGLSQVAEVFVVAQHGEDGGLEAMELLGVVALENGAQAAVDDVAADEDEVGLLGIDEVHPSRQLCLAVVVAYMKVAGEDYGQRLLQGLGGREGQFLAIFVVIVDAAQGQYERKDTNDREQPNSAILKEGFRQQMAERGYIGQKEDDEEVEEGYQPCVAHFIEHDSCIDGQAVDGEETDKHAGHPQQEQCHNGQLQRPAQRRDAPKVPAEVGCEGEDEGQQGE